jgi:uncharacterized membrane protein
MALDVHPQIVLFVTGRVGIVIAQKKYGVVVDSISGGHELAIQASVCLPRAVKSTCISPYTFP